LKKPSTTGCFFGATCCATEASGTDVSGLAVVAIAALAVTRAATSTAKNESVLTTCRISSFE
jgi:hypothetical protein